jgi:hypothetical protein
MQGIICKVITQIAIKIIEDTDNSKSKLSSKVSSWRFPELSQDIERVIDAMEFVRIYLA